MTTNPIIAKGILRMNAALERHNQGASTRAKFSQKIFMDKNEVFDTVVSFDGQEYKCADGSSIRESGDYFTHKLTNGVTRVYADHGSLIRISREDLPDGRARVYEIKNVYNMRFNDDDCFLSYERDEDGNYKRYGKKEDNTWERADEVTEEGREDVKPVAFSQKIFVDKNEVFDTVVSFDGQEYKCADGSSIRETGDYFTHKLTNGVTRVYADHGSLIRISREDLPDGRARVYEIKNVYNMRFNDDDCFLSYERDEDGNYKRYGKKEDNTWERTGEVTEEGREEGIIFLRKKQQQRAEKEQEASANTKAAFDAWLKKEGIKGPTR